MKSRKIGGVHVQHLGSLNTHSILLVVGRSNYRNKSTQINDIATQLHSSNLSVVWYESKAAQHARLRDEELAGIDSSWLQLFSESHMSVEVADKTIPHHSGPRRRIWLGIRCTKIQVFRHGEN